MGWTDPTTHIWASLEVLTAANMDTYIEQNLAYLYGDPTWTNVGSFSNSWVAYGGTSAAPGYRAFGAGVLLRGQMKSGTINTAAFTLPVNYRPAYTMNFAVASNGTIGIVQISSAGVVTPAVGNNTYVALDGIRFDTLA